MTNKFKKDINVLHKKVLIGGVDISKCPYFDNEDNEMICSLFLDGISSCRVYKDCHYKKYLHKKQEINELKNDYAELEKRHNDSFEQFKNLKMICDDYKIANAELEKECERLKEENEKLAIKCMQNDEVSTFFNTPIEGWSDNPCDICESKQEYEKLQQEKDQIKKYLGISHKTILERLEELQDFKDKDTTKLLKYEQTLDEIEEICKNGVYDEFRMPLDECSVILNIINKTKE